MMERLPFDPYDFFGYLASGLLVVVGMDLVLGFPRVLGEDLKAVDTALLLLAAALRTPRTRRWLRYSRGPDGQASGRRPNVDHDTEASQNSEKWSADAVYPADLVPRQDSGPPQSCGSRHRWPLEQHRDGSADKGRRATVSANDTLLTALGSVLSLQRWNFVPRIETWVEAENAVYVCHVGYALGRVKGFEPDHLVCYLQRCLLKSLSKHFTTDIPVSVREQIRNANASAWAKLVDTNAGKTSALFPRHLAPRVKSYLENSPTYQPASKDPAKVREEVESVLNYTHNRVAAEECEVNQKSFRAEYGNILADIRKRVAAVPDRAAYDKIYKRMKTYFVTIKRLKYLRRWNRINRVINTSVLAHTYVVTALAMLLCWLEENTIRDRNIGRTDFQYQSLLRSLFHDLPESLTGDVISPVKDQISSTNKEVWSL